MLQKQTINALRKIHHYGEPSDRLGLEVRLLIDSVDRHNEMLEVMAVKIEELGRMTLKLEKLAKKIK